MSIKRRMRRLNAEEEKPPDPVPKAAAKGKAAAKPSAEEEKDTKDTGLPERQWQGIPKYELRALFFGDSWPEDPMLAESDIEEKKKELTETLKSFRSRETQKQPRYASVQETCWTHSTILHPDLCRFIVEMVVPRCFPHQLLGPAEAGTPEDHRRRKVKLHL